LTLRHVWRTLPLLTPDLAALDGNGMRTLRAVLRENLAITLLILTVLMLDVVAALVLAK